ncbi:unnamed protein product [Prunus armeniaca]
MSKSLVKPRDILVTIKDRDAMNVSTMKTIYNARIRNRTKEFAGRTQMQQLLTKLSEHSYIEWHRTSGDIVTDLFWTHPTNIDIMRAFPHVLIMDCTYKTNRYRFPLLQIMGVTSTNMTFSIAYVYMNAEKEDNYTWALTALRKYIFGEVPLKNRKKFGGSPLKNGNRFGGLPPKQSNNFGGNPPKVQVQFGGLPLKQCNHFGGNPPKLESIFGKSGSNYPEP